MILVDTDIVKEDNVYMSHEMKKTQAQMLDDAATFYLRYNPSRSPADDAWPDALRAGAESLRQVLVKERYEHSRGTTDTGASL